MAQDYWKAGTWNAVCAVCGFQFKADELKDRWDGVRVCTQDWEPRNILDFFKVKEDRSQTVPWSQPDPDVNTSLLFWVTSGGQPIDWVTSHALPIVWTIE